MSTAIAICRFHQKPAGGAPESSDCILDIRAGSNEYSNRYPCRFTRNGTGGAADGTDYCPKKWWIPGDSGQMARIVSWSSLDRSASWPIVEGPPTARLLAYWRPAQLLSWSSLDCCGISPEMTLEPIPRSAIASDIWPNPSMTYCCAHWIRRAPARRWRWRRRHRLPVSVGTARYLLLCSLVGHPSGQLEAVPRLPITVISGITRPALRVQQ